MRINSFITLSLFVTLNSFTGYAKDKPIAIIASGETHAMLDACDCPGDPAGGFPKRSEVINKLRKEKMVLLLDAGGFAGGGIYDFYTEGRPRDSIRTLLAIKAMAAIGYDAVAIGDEELQYGVKWLVQTAQEVKLPLVSANSFYATGNHVTEPYVIVKKGTVTFGVTAVTTTERLFQIDTSVIVKDPVRSIQSLWKELNKKSDYQVILSHLGEEYTLELAKLFPDCEIVVNGHRKTSIQPVITSDNQIVMQFGFQGKNLSEVDFNTVDKSFNPIKNKWIDVDYTVSDDAGVLGITSGQGYDQLLKMTVIDLYLMSQCPYGIAALQDLLNLQENFPYIELNVWFIGDVNPDGSLHSLGGKQEIEDEKIWLAVKNLYPKLWDDFLFLCTSEGLSTKRSFTDLELDTGAIYQWVKEKGEKELTFHYQRSQRLNVNASPTMFLNNHMFGSEISYLGLAKDFCSYIEKSKSPRICDSLPECFEHSDCRKEGKVGICAKSEEGKGGKCRYKDAVKFDFTIVIPDSPIIHTEHNAINTTKELFPGAAIHVFPMSSPKGRKLIRNIDAPYLPLYLFDKKVQEAHNFSKIESGLIGVGEWYTFRDDVMQKQYFLKRSVKKDTIVLYIDPLFSGIDQVLKVVVKMFPDLNSMNVKPIIYDSIITKRSLPEEKIRQEEALRWLLLLENYGNKKFAAYLNSYRVKPGSSYWFSTLKGMKINVDDFVKKIEKNSKLLKELIKEIMEFEIEEPVVLLLENREIIPIMNQSHFEEILGKVKKKYRKSK